MYDFKVGDIVARKSYGGDVYFTIVDIINKDGGKPVYVLRGMLFRIFADSAGDDLVKQNPKNVQMDTRRYITDAKRHALTRNQQVRVPFLMRLRAKPGRILHIDSAEDFMNRCLQHYKDAKITAYGTLADENRQPQIVRRNLEKYRPNILVLTGHDSVKKDTGDMNSLDNYRNSRYFIEAVKEARRFEPDLNKLCIFAGACQSYFEGIMAAGANFASSPGRVFINALDPALVAEKISLTDSKKIVTASQAAAVTITGPSGIGGIDTRGHLMWV